MHRESEDRGKDRKFQGEEAAREQGSSGSVWRTVVWWQWDTGWGWGQGTEGLMKREKKGPPSTELWVMPRNTGSERDAKAEEKALGQYRDEAGTKISEIKTWKGADYRQGCRAPNSTLDADHGGREIGLGKGHRTGRFGCTVSYLSSSLTWILEKFSQRS